MKTEEDGPIGKILYRCNGGRWTLLATFEGSFGHEDKLFICEQALNKSYGEGHEFLATFQAEDYLEE